MASLSTISIKRPVLTIVMSLMIIIFGIIGFTRLGVREYPSIDPPIINVRTTYSGANSDVIESQITEPLEEAINGIAGIRSITSASNQGSSNITVEFNLDADLEAAANDVRDKVSGALRKLPNDLTSPPVVSKADANSDAIISMTIRSSDRNPLELTYYADNVLKEQLQTIPGVSGIQIWGEKQYAMRLWLDPTRLAAYKLTPNDVSQALQQENVELPAGKIAGENTELTIRMQGRLRTEVDFNSLVIKNTPDGEVRLKDLGYARLGAQNDETILKNRGVPMVALAMVPLPGANYIEIADEFYKRMERIKLEVPDDIELDIAMDNTTFVRNSVNEVEETLLIAFLLVVVVIFLFLRDWRSTIIPVVAIPISLISSFFIMYFAGFSINVLTLLGIVLATGLVVDDAIVVLENIYAKIEQGMKPREASFAGANEIFFAVLSTTLTLAAVFLPIIFLEGFTGRLFREFGIVVAGSVIVSAFVSLTLTPMMCARLLKRHEKPSRFYASTERFYQRLNDAYSNSLGKFMQSRWWSWLILGAASALIFIIGRAVPSELAPLDDRSLLRMSISAPEGASFAYTDSYIDSLTRFVNDSVPEVQVLLTVTAPSFAGSGATNTGFARLRLNQPDKRERTQEQVANYISKHVAKMPQAKGFVIQEPTIASGRRAGLPVQFVIQAPNFEKLREKLPIFMDSVGKNPTFSFSDVNLKFNKPEVNININRERARKLGVSALELGRTLQQALSEQRYGYFTINGKQFEIIGQFQRKYMDDPTDLRSIYVRSDKGEMIQLDNLVQIEEQSNPPQLYHFNRYTSATVSAGLAEGKTIGEGIDAMNSIASAVLDQSFSTALDGSSRDYAESSSNVIFAFLLALLLIYLILAAQFESFRDPFIIMLTVPLALAGALLSLWYFGQTLNIFSQIGIIMLIGLVTKNGILIVEFANQRKEQGINRLQAVKEAAASRFRPILMTSFATALGALPIALALGAGAKSRVGMGIVVIGGVIFSLILTLYVIPAIYSFISRETRGRHEEEGDERPILLAENK